MLNFIFCAFFLVAFANALFLLCAGQTDIFNKMLTALFEAASNGFNISIGLTGMLCLWLGLLKIAQESGLTNILAKALNPLFKRIMPEIPENHPAMGSIIMNMAANILGLDNAATPMGLKAMSDLQSLNKHKDKASNAQVLFMVINASAVTLIPINILMYRHTLGCLNPAAVFIPILLATSVSTLAGFLSVAFVQKLDIFNKVVLSYLLCFMLLISGTAYWFMHLSADLRLTYSNLLASLVIFSFIVCFIGAGIIKHLNVYEVFIAGAKEGFQTAVQIIPYLVSMLCAIAVFRASGVMDLLTEGFTFVFKQIGLNTDFTPALPTAFLKPLSGSGARAMMIETLTHYGPNSFEGFVSSVMQGSTETTFYVLAVYFGSVKISKTGAALPCALFADFMGLSAAIILSYIFY